MIDTYLEDIVLSLNESPSIDRFEIITMKNRVTEPV